MGSISLPKNFSPVGSEESLVRGQDPGGGKAAIQYQMASTPDVNITSQTLSQLRNGEMETVHRRVIDFHQSLWKIQFKTKF